MLRSLILFHIIVATLAAPPFRNDFQALWETYKEVFGKKYNSLSEEASRRTIWEINVDRVLRHNLEADLKQYGFRLGINQFSDMSQEEYNTRNHLKVRNSTLSASTFLAPSNVQYPNSIDWREYGYVTHVKDQGDCESCWAFSATGSLEGQHKKKTGKLISLSEQNLVDCSTDEGNKGCNRGLVDNAFEYIKKNNGIDTEDAYPYTGKDGKCHFDKKAVGATLTGRVDIPMGNETALMEAVATVGPVSVAIDARGDFKDYTRGIYDNENCDSMNLTHAVLVVGYGEEHGKEFWIVKNSWGNHWGENGYIRMTRNKNNQCGIATLATYPLV